MDVEIKDVVKAQKLGSPGSMYVLLPASLCSELKINEGDEFLLCLDAESNIVLKRKETSKH